MKESNSFQDALKRVLIPEEQVKAIPKPKKKKTSNYVSEAMGTSSPSSITQGGGLQGFSSPGDEGGRTGIDLRDIGNEESKKAKAHGSKPYPLDTVLDHIAKSGESLQNAQSIIDISIRKNDVALTPEQKEVLKKVQKTIASSLGNISKAAMSVDSITL